MENAAKALLIAGGVLMALIVTSVLVYVFNEVKSVPQTQDQIKAAQQLAEFNKKYESYNKQKMYGNEVISVINMAVNNNNTYRNDTNYQIDIEVTTKEINSRIRLFYYDHEEQDSKKAVKEASTPWPKTNKSIVGEIYDLNKITSNVGWKEILDVTNGESKSEFLYSDSNGQNTTEKLDWIENNISINRKTYKKYYYMTTNLAYEFKNLKFKCIRVEHNEEGRVSKMIFQQL